MSCPFDKSKEQDECMRACLCMDSGTEHCFWRSQSDGREHYTHFAFYSGSSSVRQFRRRAKKGARCKSCELHLPSTFFERRALKL